MLSAFAHLWEVVLEVDRPRFPVRLRLPAWIPGSYLIREFARHIEGVEARLGTVEAGSGGTFGSGDLEVRKVDKATWEVDLPQSCSKAASAEGDDGAGGGESDERAGQVEAVVVRYRVYAWDLSVRTSHLDGTHGFFNGSSVFMAVEGREDGPCTLDIVEPQHEGLGGWRVATTLEPVNGTSMDGFGLRRASCFDELIDHPVEMGRFASVDFSAGGCRHVVALTGRVQADLQRLGADLQRICAAQMSLFEPQTRCAPVQDYAFLITAVDGGYGGLEHRSSTALLCGRDDLPAPGDYPAAVPDPASAARGVPGDEPAGFGGDAAGGEWAGFDGVDRREGYVGLLGLASHEYFHTWHVKRIKPAAFAPYRLDRENHTSLLWIFEGFTAYYDDLFLRRAGLISSARYVQLLQKAIRGVLATPGHTVQSVAESSFDAWIKFYRPDENTVNSVANYYGKGSLVALCLDLGIRIDSGGRRSLDDVMRLMWQRLGRGFYGAGVGAGAGGCGLGEDDFPAVVEEATGVEMSARIRDWAYGVGPLPLKEALESVGVEWSEEADAQARVALGGRLSRAGAGGDGVGLAGFARIASAFRDGALEQAGLSAGDVIVAVDGLRFDEKRERVMLRTAAPGDVVPVHALRRDELIVTQMQWQPVKPLVRLSIRDDVDAVVIGARQRWLGADGKG